ncbi:MAG: EamA family transporter [Alphaproteobacteria bacterium]
MVNYLWFFYALGASVLWGLGYVLSEKVLKAGITPIFYLLVVSVLDVVVFGILAMFEGFSSNLQLLADDRRNWTGLILTTMVFAVANILISYGIVTKNATMASFIEISYPIFTAFFAWLILKETQFNCMTLIGGALIFTGIGFVFVGGK